jgi:hypothetical protein
VMLGFDYPFTMIATIRIDNTSFSNADYDISGAAISDPIITIDPSFPFINDVRLDFSPNLFSPVSSPVPEPSTLLSLVAGLLVLGERLYRRSAGRRNTRSSVSWPQPGPWPWAATANCTCNYSGPWLVACGWRVRATTGRAWISVRWVDRSTRSEIRN